MRRRNSIFLVSVAATAFAVLPTASGYIRLNTQDPTQLADLIRADASGIQYFLNSGVVPGATSTLSGKSVQVFTTDSNPASALNAAIASWAGIATASTAFLKVQPTTIGIVGDDLKNVVAIAADTTTFSALNGVLALTVNTFAAGTGTIGPFEVKPGSIIDSDIIINPGVAFSTNGTTGADLQSVLAHEVGHSLGANHTGILGATMFQKSAPTQRTLSLDDTTFLSTVYPKTSAPAALGRISGAITLAGGGPAVYPLVTAIDTSTGAILGGLGDTSGAWSIQVPPGSYVIYAEPLGGIVQAANLYFTQAQANAATRFQATMLGGATNPTAVPVANGATATANIAVTAGTTTLQFQNAAFGPAGGSGETTALASISGPISVSSGKTQDIVFYGASLDSSTTDANFRIFGAGISVVAGSVRADPKILPINGLPYLRATLNIPARTTQGLATIFITKGANTLALSGIVVLGPQTPAFPVAGIVNAATFSNSGVVAPGEIVTVFGTNVGPANLIPADFNSLGVFSKNTGDTRVLFDNVPAPMIYSFGAQTSVVVPYSVSGKQTTQVVVEYQGVASAAVTVPVRATAPGMFPGLAANQAVAFNSDNKTINSAATPETRGTGVVVLFLTGEGQTNPGGVDGQAAISVFPKPLATVAVSIGGQNLNAGQIKYFGAAPNLIAGLMQLNVEIPAGIPAGPAAVVVTIGGVASPAANIFVK